jgi:hypothetical protein
VIASYPGLTVLQVRVGSADSREGVSLTLLVQGSAWNSLKLDWSDLGADDEGRLRSESHDWTRFAPPPSALGSVERFCASLPASAGSGPLWLDFGQPSGVLALLPWERWLVPITRRPILRLPYLPLDTQRTIDQFDIALCASKPASKAGFPLPNLVDETVRAFLSVHPKCRVHVFVDDAEFSSVRGLIRDFVPEQDRVVLYDPSAARQFSVPARRSDTSGEEERGVESPWLLWMLDALAQTTLDAAHFICHTYFSEGRGALAFAESPLLNRDRAWARFVGPLQLAAFLDQTGAWALGFTPPDDNLSPAGVRALADQVAQRRPGPVVLHEREHDAGGEQLAATYRYLTRMGPPAAAASITLYSDPALVATDRSTPRRMTSARVARSSGPVGRIRAASQRVLDRSLAELEAQAPSESKAGAAAQRGVEEALDFVADLLNKTVKPES